MPQSPVARAVPPDALSLSAGALHAARLAMDLAAASDQSVLRGDLVAARGLMKQARRAAKNVPVGPARSVVVAVLDETWKRVAKALGAAARVSARREADAQKRLLAVSRCADCSAKGTKAQLTNKSGRVRCGECHTKWAGRTCARCLRRFKRTAETPRQRLCAACGGGRAPALRTVSGGLPTLGRRR